MKIVNETLLDRFRGPGRCEWCGKQVKNRDPHHIYTRGAGRVDAAPNIISLCVIFSGGNDCHGAAQAGMITRYDLLAKTAQREACLQGDITSIVWFFRRLDKDSSDERIALALGKLSESAAALARRVLREIGR